MFIDYLTLLLINMAAGLVAVAFFVLRGLDDPNKARWTPAFAMPGLIALIGGLAIAMTWPLPGPYSAAFGDLSVLLGVLLLGTALALSRGWDLLPVTIYAFFGGLAAVLVGVRCIVLQLTAMPALTGVGMILTGIAGIFAGPVLCMHLGRTWRVLGAVVLLAAAAIWAFDGFAGYWMHLESFGKWQPLIMR